jgi:excisionase family DNA binding protein
MSLIEHYQRFLTDTGSEVAAAIFAIDAFYRDSQEKSSPRAQYVTVKDAAARFNLGERTIYRMIEGGLPTVRAGRAIRINPQDLEKWLEDSETILR